MELKSFKIIFLPLLLIMFCMTACEDLYIVDCDDCELIEPTTCQLNIDLRADGNVYDVTIYKGKIEDGLILLNTARTTSFSYTVGLNSEYTVTATVAVNGAVYTAVDATRPRVDVITDECEDTCYWIVHNNINLKFKYY